MRISRAGPALPSWPSSQEVDSGWYSVGHTGHREIDGHTEWPLGGKFSIHTHIHTRMHSRMSAFNLFVNVFPSWLFRAGIRLPMKLAGFPVTESSPMCM